MQVNASKERHEFSDNNSLLLSTNAPRKLLDHLNSTLPLTGLDIARSAQLRGLGVIPANASPAFLLLLPGAILLVGHASGVRESEAVVCSLAGLVERRRETDGRRARGAHAAALVDVLDVALLDGDGLGVGARDAQAHAAGFVDAGADGTHVDLVATREVRVEDVRWVVVVVAAAVFAHFARIGVQSDEAAYTQLGLVAGGFGAAASHEDAGEHGRGVCLGTVDRVILHEGVGAEVRETGGRVCCGWCEVVVAETSELGVEGRSPGVAVAACNLRVDGGDVEEVCDEFRELGSEVCV